MGARLPLLAACLALLCLAVPAQPSQAQDDDGGDGGALPSLNLHLPDPENQGNDRAVESLPVAPAGPEALGLALQYYDYCRAHADPLLSSDAAEAACACKSQQVKDHFSAPQIKGMMDAPGGEKPDRKTVIDTVEAPCLEFPARQYAFNQCYSDKGIRFTMQTDDQLTFMCGCVGGRIAAYFRDFAAYQLDAIMVKKPDISDPLGAIMISNSYNSEYGRARVSCSVEAQKLRVSPDMLKSVYHR